VLSPCRDEGVVPEATVAAFPLINDKADPPDIDATLAAGAADGADDTDDVEDSDEFVMVDKKSAVDDGGSDMASFP